MPFRFETSIRLSLAPWKDCFVAHDLSLEKEEDVKLLNTCHACITELVVDGSDLFFLRRQFEGTPFTTGKSCRWKGDMAQFIAMNARHISLITLNRPIGPDYRSMYRSMEDIFRDQSDSPPQSE